MEIRVLRYFLAVAEELNITKAAEYLCIAQPSLSKQMQALEEELGRKLFERGSRKIVLTEAGIRLKKRAEEIIELVEVTESELQNAMEPIAGEVRLGGGESYAVGSVVQAAKRFREQHPGVTFEFFSGDGDSVMERLESGLIDFGIFVDWKELDRYNSVRLPMSDTWGALARRDSHLAAADRVTAKSLVGEPLILPRQPLKKRDSELMIRLKDVFPKLDIRARYNLIYNAALMVKAGMGTAITIDKLVNTEGTELVFLPFEPPLVTHLDFVWKKHASLSRPAEAFLALLRSGLANR